MNSIIQSLSKLRIYPYVGNLIEQEGRKFTIYNEQSISHIDGYDGYIRMVQGSTSFGEIEITPCQKLIQSRTQYVLVIWGDWNEDILPYIANTLKLNDDVTLRTYTNNCAVIKREEGFDASLRFVFDYTQILNNCIDVVCGC